ncbi:MAG: lactate racemase domain-containing protein [Gaiellaceae bacterium]
MTRIPLLAGTRVVVVQAPEDAVVLRPPPPGEGIDDVAAAVRDALRYPLQGPALEQLAPAGGSATIVIEPPALPIPGSPFDPRKAAVEAVSRELERAGLPVERQTLLVASGLARRPAPRDVETLVTRELARRFTGRLVVHDAEDPELVELSPGLRVNGALVRTDLVVVVSAAHTFLHGGPAVFLGAAGPEVLRAAAGAPSLLETAGSDGWRAALELERLLGTRVATMGVSLALNHPRLGGALQGYPYEEDALERVARSPLRPLFGALPGALRARVLQSLRSELTASAVFAGPPSVAHAETLLRSIEARSTPLEGRLDALCVAVPRTTPYLPRERPNPLLAAHLGLAYALRLWRDAFPVADGGAVILLHRFHRRFAHPTQQPYRGFFAAARHGREPDELAEAERNVAVDERARELYRSGRSCHPLLPYADWAACAPTLARLSTVLVAGCRDAVAARQLGFVPTRSVAAALAMVEGTLGRPPRVGFLVTPPFFPIQVRA